uniref:Bifunctional inhibitor/plant lipid transfer protein/seed storage helical domain-containing protein n=1 Tax=Hordeum vulgare subsp. vulgare TaxID=112509 RepID=A0A8I6WFA4_HORVV
MTYPKLARVLCLLDLVAISSYLHHARALDHCIKDKDMVMKYCWHNIVKKLGDQFPHHWSQCCQKIREAVEIHCVCDRFTAQELNKIDVWRFAIVTHVCGNGLHSHTHCAGYLVPVITLPPPPGPREVPRPSL